MRILGLGIRPPPAARDNPSVTPELLASSLARYSRSNKGIDAILSSIDWDDPDSSVDAIFKFVDYGHASIAGMTGGIAIVIDGCSMFLAYKLFELSSLCDGQESSTRYIKLDTSSLPRPQDIGIPGPLAAQWEALMARSFELYQETYDLLDAASRNNPAVVRAPPGAGPKIEERLRKNYALDRARYFIPFATKTNAALVMTARAWAETVRQLDSLHVPEARACAAGLRRELQKFVPRLLKHSFPDEASISQARLTIDAAVHRIAAAGAPTARLADDCFVSVDNRLPPFLPERNAMDEAFDCKTSRYSTVGRAVKRIMVRAAWNNMAVAELRDLNRHRTGYRFSPLVPVGFYLPDGVTHPALETFLAHKRALTEKLAASAGDAGAGYVYGLHLGDQVAFEHSTHLDKFMYEIELRTGLGAHFRYGEHLAAAGKKLVALMPELAAHIRIGTAEPE